jgi:hypothetical protein
MRIKTLFYLFLHTVLTAIFLSSCNWDKDYEAFTTDLEVIVLDANNQAVANAQVFLYRSEFDMLGHLYPEFEGKTDEKGVASFKDIDPMNYFVYAFYAKEGKFYDNSTKSHEVGSDLIEGSLTEVKVKTEYSRPEQPSKFAISEVRLVNYETNLDSNRWLELGLYKVDAFDVKGDPIEKTYDYLIGNRAKWDLLFSQSLRDTTLYYRSMPNVLLQSIKVDDFQTDGFEKFGIIDIEKDYGFFYSKFKNPFPLEKSSGKKLVFAWTERFKFEGKILTNDYPYGAVLTSTEYSKENKYHNIDRLNQNPIGANLPAYPYVVRIEFTAPRKGTIDLHLKWY